MVRVRSLDARQNRGRKAVRPLGAALAAVVLTVFSGMTVHALSASTTTLTASTNPTVWGQSVTFTATITPVAPAPTGAVTFQDGGINIATCVARAVAARVATCTTSTLAIASHTVTAVYSGDATYAGSTSAAVVQVVNKGTTTSVVTSSANPSVSGQAVTYTTTVTATPPASGTRTGTVNFQDGGVTIVGCGAKAVAAAGTATCAIAYAGPGVHSVTGVYSGDTNFLTSTSAVLTQTVGQGNTTSVVTSSANPSASGQTVTYTTTVTATAPASGTRTGTVNFQDAGVTIAGCGAKAVAVAGTATCAVTYAGPGSHPITDLYSGDVNFVASSSAVLTQTVNQGNTGTAVASSLNPSSTGASVTLTATVTATAPASGTRTGSVNFQDAGITITGCGAQAVAVAGTATCATSALSVGSHAITVVYSGDANFATSTSATLTQTVINATSTTVTSSVNPSVFGQSVQYTAAVAGGPVPTGTITFRDGGVNIGGCVAVVMTAAAASCTVSPTVGSHAITAVYGGDASHAASTSAALTQTVNADPTTTNITSTVTPSVFGQSVTFTATVTANGPGAGTPGGTVTFKDGGISIGGCTNVAMAAGVATCTTAALTVANHSITAVYNGNATFTTSTSAVFTQTVNKGATATVATSAANPSLTGQVVVLTATLSATAPAAGAPSGTVNFLDAGMTIAGCGARAIAAGKATCTASFATAGPHAITAVYSGDTSFLTSTSAALTQNVNQAATSTVLTSSVNPSVAGQAVTFTATVSAIAPGAGTPTGTINFEDGGITITGCGARAMAARVATCPVTFPLTGSQTITAVYSADANYTASTSASLTQTVNAGASKTVITSSVNPSVTGQSVTYTATVTPVAPATGTPTGTITFKDGAATVAGCGAQVLATGVTTCSTTYGAPGSHGITGAYSGDASFGVSTSVVLTQVVNKGATSSVVTSSVNPSVSGEAVTYTATVTATAPASGTPTGTVNFRDGGVTIAGCGAQPLVAGIAACSVVYAGVGTHAITAVYSGDADFSSSTSPILTQTVNPGATTTALTSSVNPSVAGEAVTYTATVTATAPASGTPTGTVNFRDAGVTIAGCAAQAVGVAATATCAVAYAGVGTHAITGTYSGDANFTISISPILTQTVNPGATTTALTSSSDPSVSGQGLTYTATVTATAPASGTPTGTVNFRDAGVTIAGCGAQPLVAGIASCSVVYAGVGTHAITAVYSGDADFTSSTSPVLTQTVNQGATTTALTSSVNPSVSGEGLTYTATVTATAPASGTATGTAAFLDGGSTIAGCGAQPLVAGIAACSVVYAGTGARTRSPPCTAATRTSAARPRPSSPRPSIRARPQPLSPRRSTPRWRARR